jgi:hypothetical protein
MADVKPFADAGIVWYLEQKFMTAISQQEPRYKANNGSVLPGPYPSIVRNVPVTWFPEESLQESGEAGTAGVPEKI